MGVIVSNHPSMNSFLIFPHDYEIELGLALSGRDPEKVFYFPGASQKGGKDGLLVKIRPKNGDAWFGIFAGGSGKVYSCPNEKELCVVAGDCVYMVLVDDPSSCITLMSHIEQVMPLPEHGLILFVGYLDIIAYASGGIRWHADHIGFGDGLTILDIKNGWIHGQFYDPTNQKKPLVDFDLDLESGRLAPLIPNIPPAKPKW